MTSGKIQNLNNPVMAHATGGVVFGTVITAPGAALDQASRRRRRLYDRKIPLGRRISFQERGETGLLEVLIARQGVTDILVLHHHEGNAVGQRPLFVRPSFVTTQAALEQFGARADDPHLGVLFEGADELRDMTAAGGFRQRIGELGEHPLGGEQVIAQLAGGGNDPGVMLVGAVEQSDEIEGIREDGLHFLRCPWT